MPPSKCRFSMVRRTNRIRTRRTRRPYACKPGPVRYGAVYMTTSGGTARPPTEQLQEALDMPASTERPRRVELVRGGLVRDTGARARTHSGRRAVLWAANGGPG